MGLFSSKKKVYVSSTVYNLAGDYPDRMNYLKSTVAQSVLSDSDSYIGRDIVNAHIQGPGTQQRTFFRWAKNHYSAGKTSASIQGEVNVDIPIVTSAISVGSNERAEVTSAFLDIADFSYWAEKHILENKPDQWGTVWTSDISADNTQVIIQYEGGSIDTIPLDNFDKRRRYLIAYYTLVVDIAEDAPTEGTLTGGLSSEPTAPSGYTYISRIEDPETRILTTTTTVTQSDGSSETTQSTRSETIIKTKDVHHKDVYQGLDGSRMKYNRSIFNIWRNYKTEIETTTTTTNGVTTTEEKEVLVPVWSHRTDSQVVYTHDTEGKQRMLIYKMGSGNTTFDSLDKNQGVLNEFFPFIPLRVDNKSITEEPYLTFKYPEVKKAYRKATKKRIDELLESIEDNESIDDIDYTFLVFGVPLNTREKEGKKYIYEFLKALIPYQRSSLQDYNNWLSYKETYEQKQNGYLSWSVGQEDSTSSQYGTAPPERVKITPPTMSRIILKNDLPLGGHYPFDFHINWATIQETSHIGLGKSGAKVGDIWFNKLKTDVYNEFPFYAGSRVGIQRPNNIKTWEMFNQVSSGTYRKLTIVGMTHHNYVYDGKVVDIDIDAALDDAEETGFIIPLHYPTLKKLSLKDSTQLAMSNQLLVFNSYQIVKQKWYQTGLFRILVTVAMVTLSVVTAGASAGATVGILGTNAAVGTALGLTGMTAIVAGAVANALAASILVTIIQRSSTAIFGDELGAIIGTVVSFFAIQTATSFHQTGSMSVDWGSMLQADNLLNLTNSVSDAYNRWSAANLTGMQQEIIELKEQNNEQLKEIMDKTSEVLGIGGGVIDPMIFTELSDSQEKIDTLPETSDMFIRRTLLTGSDIVKLSQEMIYSFADMSKTLPK